MTRECLALLADVPLSGDTVAQFSRWAFCRRFWNGFRQSPTSAFVFAVKGRAEQRRRARSALADTLLPLQDIRKEAERRRWAADISVAVRASGSSASGHGSPLCRRRRNRPWSENASARPHAASSAKYLRNLKSEVQCEWWPSYPAGLPGQLEPSTMRQYAVLCACIQDACGRQMDRKLNSVQISFES